jgi:hypothetical protein
MAFQNWMERHYKAVLASGTTDVVIGALPAGVAIQVHGCRVTDLAATGAVAFTDGAGTTFMSATDVAVTATGLKANTTSGPFMTTAARSLTADITTSLADAAEIIFYCAVAKVEPGAGEV